LLVEITSIHTEAASMSAQVGAAGTRDFTAICYPRSPVATALAASSRRRAARHRWRA
jgi:hypothetical protein